MATSVGSRVILLFGAHGQVGYELKQRFAASASLITLDIPAVDFSRPDSLRAIVRQHRPDIIINAAAYTAVDKAESEPERVHAINALAPKILAEEAEALGACLVHYSTDYVFDGRKSSPYRETDTPNPLSTYGRSKLEGEQAVRACKRHLTLRTSWVFGVHGKNFVKTILQLAGERDALRVVDDQFGAPTSAALLSRVTDIILSHMAGRPSEDARWGLYHLVAGGGTSWHGLACHVIARAALLGQPLRTKPEAIVAIATAEYPLPAARPSNSRLDTSKLRSTFGVALPEWAKGVDDMLDQLILGIKR